MIPLLLSRAVGIDRWPQPNCHYRVVPKNLPLVVSETIIGNLDDEFKGYNLDFSVLDDPTNSVHISNKMQLLASYQTSLPGLRNFHIDHYFNDWGENFNILSEVNGVTVVHIGKMINGKPVINNQIIVDNKTNQRCYDTYWDQQLNLLIVDCAVKLQQPDEDGNLYQNIFYYIDTRNNSKLEHTYSTELYVPFTQMWRRRVYNYTDPASGLKYLVRVYFQDGVDFQHSSNSYFQIYSMNNPYYPWIVKVVDRAFIGRPSFKIADFKIYQGDFYLIDPQHGIYRFDFTKGLNIIMLGVYRADMGFTRFGVFHSRLDGKELIALANSHAIYEIDWTSNSRPVELAKYSILHNSMVRQVWLNEDFVIVQATANVSLDNSFVLNNYTWIMSRGDRTYGNAFKVIDHSRWDVFVDLNRRMNRILVVNQTGIYSYQLNLPMISIVNNNPNLVGKNYSILVVAVSSDPYAPKQTTCTLTLNLSFVNAGDMSIFQIGQSSEVTYSTIFPGQARVALFNYFIGPNITYSLKSKNNAQEPDAYILQQNKSNLVWPNAPKSVKFFRMFERFEKEQSIIIVQDAAHILHIGQCEHRDFTNASFNCITARTYPMGAPIKNMSIFPQGQTHIVSYLINQTVIVMDLNGDRIVFQRTYPDGFLGEISDVSVSQQCVFVTLKYTKTVECHSRTFGFRGFTIDQKLANSLGINYWAPVSVTWSHLHPRIFFVSTLDAVHVMDFGTDHIVRKLTTLQGSAAFAKPGFKVSINYEFLVIAQTPKIIEQYLLLNVYKGSVPLLKSYYLYQYQLLSEFNITLSRFTDLLFVEAYDSAAQVSCILVFIPGRPSQSVLYDVINLQKKHSVFMDTSGFLVNYVGIVASGQLRIVREFDFPVFISQTFIDHNYTLHADNPKNSAALQHINVKVVSIPNNVTINKTIAKTINLEGVATRSFSDKDWVDGSVIDYKCLNCGQKVQFRPHLYERADIISSYGLFDYTDSAKGGYTTTFQGLFQMRKNGSIDQIYYYPSHQQFQSCVRVSADILDSFTVTACQNFGSVNLYLTSFTSSKGFTMGPFASDAVNARKLQTAGNLIMLVDVNRYPQFKFYPGIIFIYDLNSDPEDEILEEIESIDYNDVMNTLGWTEDVAYFGNADLQFTMHSNQYRLFITELQHGLFTLHFTYIRGSKQLNIIRTQFTDLVKILSSKGYNMPLGTTFQAVRILGFHYNVQFREEQVQLLVTTDRYHSFVFNVTLNNASAIIDVRLMQVLLKYGYYNTANYVKSFDGMVGISLYLPRQFHWIDRLSKQVLALYDLKTNLSIPIDKVQEVHFIGGIKSNSTFEFTYDFNFTAQRHNQTFQITDAGIMAIDPMGIYMRQLRVSRNLTLDKNSKLNSLGLQLLVSNDYFNATDTLLLLSDDYLEWYQILLIVLFGIGLLVAAGYAGLSLLRKGGESVDSQLKSSPLLAEQQDMAEQQAGNNQQS